MKKFALACFVAFVLAFSVIIAPTPSVATGPDASFYGWFNCPTESVCYPTAFFHFQSPDVYRGGVIYGRTSANKKYEVMKKVVLESEQDIKSSIPTVTTPYTAGSSFSSQISFGKGAAEIVDVQLKMVVDKFSKSFLFRIQPMNGWTSSTCRQGGGDVKIQVYVVYMYGARPAGAVSMQIGDTYVDVAKAVKGERDKVHALYEFSLSRADYEDMIAWGSNPQITVFSATGGTAVIDDTNFDNYRDLPTCN